LDTYYLDGRGHLLRDAAKGLQYAHSGGGERGTFIIYRKRPVISPSLFRGLTMEIQLALGNVFHILFCAGTFPDLSPTPQPPSVETRPSLLLESYKYVTIYTYMQRIINVSHITLRTHIHVYYISYMYTADYVTYSTVGGLKERRCDGFTHSI